MGKIFKKIKYIHFFWLFFYIFLFGLLLNNSFGYLDPDFGWHLKVGQEIAQTGFVPHLNHFNYTYTGNWVDHEWLSNYLIYQVYSHYGYPALNFAFAGLIIIVLLILNFLAKAILPKNVSPALLMALEGLGVIACLPHFGVRIQELALLFLVVLLALIYFYNQKKDWRLLAVLPFWLYLWANLHASFLIGFFIIFAFAGLKLIERLIYDFRPAYSRWLDFSQVLRYREIGLVFLFSAISTVAAFFTPYRAELFSFLRGYGNTVYFRYIEEWFSQFSFPFYYWQLVYLAVVFLALLIYIYNICHKKNRTFNLWTFFIIVLFFFLGFKSRRHFPLLFVSSLIFLAEIYFVALPARAERKLDAWLNFFLLFCFVCLAVSELIKIRPVADPFNAYCREYPCGAVSFLKDNPVYADYNLYNHYGWGGYLIAVYPERKIFIDGRLPQINFAGRTFLEEYMSFSEAESDRKAKLDQYNIKLVLLPTKLNNLKAKPWEKFLFNIKDDDLIAVNRLRDYLLVSPEWQRVYYDPVASIFLKK